MPLTAITLAFGVVGGWALTRLAHPDASRIEYSFDGVSVAAST
jgi:hypothetical protein